MLSQPRLRSYNQTGPANTSVVLTVPVGYVWNITQLIVATDAAADAGKPAVVYAAQVRYDSIVAVAPLITTTDASAAVLNLTGAIEFQEQTLIARVPGSVGSVSLTAFAEVELLSEVSRRQRSPGMNHALLVSDQGDLLVGA